MSASGSFRIRPAGRHILTIGRDLIQDSYAAVVELVKNAYDADSPDVSIDFAATPECGGYKIVISDHGHGMSRDTVINKWMVPSTDDKRKRRESPAGRKMQGSKGIGRFAAAVLGKNLLLETTSKGENTTLFVVWEDFENAQFLDDVEVLIETAETSDPSGTRLTIKGDDEFLANWDERQFRKLQYELKKLVSPVDALMSDNPFSIKLRIEGFSEKVDLTESVEPYPIFDFFDYRIAGTVSSDGTGTLTYSLQKVRNTTDEEIPFRLGSPTGCGELVYDIRVYDREKEAIDSLIQRGLKDKLGNYVEKNEAKNLLNANNGIGVYRGGFRIRPLGDTEFDWLKLNYRRVQKPSQKIGSNQVIGYVQIQPEEQSFLIEKSARDGLKENEAYDQLKRITEKVISELETRRFNYRLKAGLSRPSLKVERDLESLFSYDGLKREVRTQLNKVPFDQSAADKIIEIIDREEEEKNRVVEEIRKAVAIYQDHATLGKIINVILHEGRRPLSYFRNQIPHIRHWHKSFQETRDPVQLAKILRLGEGIGQNAEVFVSLFSRLDPLAARKRGTRKPLVIKKEIVDTFGVFEKEMKSLNVSAEVNGPESLTFPSWRQDIYAIFTNLIDNSLYWISEKGTSRREITIDILVSGDSLQSIDYRDTGPGIEPNLIASEVIFEPDFSTKPDGTGLGLAIAGEAAERSGLKLKVFESDEGAYFRLQPKTGNG